MRKWKVLLFFMLLALFAYGKPHSAQLHISDRVRVQRTCIICRAIHAGCVANVMNMIILDDITLSSIMTTMGCNPGLIVKKLLEIQYPCTGIMWTVCFPHVNI